MKDIIELKWIILLGCFIIFSCNQEKEKSAQATNKSTGKTSSLPAMDGVGMQQLRDSIDLIDIMFYELPISMSYDNPGGILSSLNHVSPLAANITPSCKPIGHVFYGAQGEHIMEAELFFSDNCTYFVFYKKGKKIYANQMTENGAKWYTSVISKVGNSPGE